LQLVVDVDDVEELDDVVVVVVAVEVGSSSSRQPHHPGVLHVSVLVRVFVDVLLGLLEVVLSVLLLS
jgi:hypothetical protein